MLLMSVSALLHSVRRRTDRARSDAYPAVGARPDMVVPDTAIRFFTAKGRLMNRIIYIVGVVVIAIAILSFFGFR